MSSLRPLLALGRPASKRTLSSFNAPVSKYAPMPWQLKMEYLKAVICCFMPVSGWAVYQETELYKIRTDESYLDDILKGSETIANPGPQGMSRAQFMQHYDKRAEASEVKKRLEKEAYDALK